LYSRNDGEQPLNTNDQTHFCLSKKKKKNLSHIKKKKKIWSGVSGKKKKPFTQIKKKKKKIWYGVAGQTKKNSCKKKKEAQCCQIKTLFY
jgi:hypothetical protein